MWLEKLLPDVLGRICGILDKMSITLLAMSSDVLHDRITNQFNIRIYRRSAICLNTAFLGDENLLIKLMKGVSFPYNGTICEVLLEKKCALFVLMQPLGWCKCGGVHH